MLFKIEYRKPLRAAEGLLQLFIYIYIAEQIIMIQQISISLIICCYFAIGTSQDDPFIVHTHTHTHTNIFFHREYFIDHLVDSGGFRHAKTS